VIALDTNVLVYAHRPEFPLHDRAVDVVLRLAEAPATWAIPFHALVEFAATVSHPRKFLEPSGPAVVRGQIDAWLASPSLRVLYDAPTVLARWLELVDAGRVTGPLHHDARIAACCLANGVTELWTADRDYLRFPALRVSNPLVR
jgi:uncharacterized protein